jgi:hypothetical protein
VQLVELYELVAGLAPFFRQVGFSGEILEALDSSRPSGK